MTEISSREAARNAQKAAYMREWRSRHRSPDWIVYVLIERSAPGQFLYVGITTNPTMRSYQHKSQEPSPIFEIRKRCPDLDICMRLVRGFPTRAQAAAYEEALIELSPTVLNKTARGITAQEWPDDLLPRRPRSINRETKQARFAARHAE